jgi:uncharacterized protein (DUF2236 family)
MPTALRHLVGTRIRHMTGSTQSLDNFKLPLGDPGLLGPSSMPWRVHAHFISMMVGGLSSLMLQALHPRALAAVWDHSNFRHDLKARLGRTAYFVAITTYGGRELALHAIERVNRIHANVKGLMPDGSAYVANEPDLLRWVHLGEVTSFLRAYQSFSLAPLSPDEEDRYMADMAVIGQHLGVQDVPLTKSDSEEALLAYLPDLRFDDRTAHIINVIENYPSSPLDRPLIKAVIQAAFDELPDWALAMIGRAPSSPLRRQAVRHGLRLVGLPLQSALEHEGVAAFSRQRVAA